MELEAPLGEAELSAKVAVADTVDSTLGEETAAVVVDADDFVDLPIVDCVFSLSMILLPIFL